MTIKKESSGKRIKWLIVIVVLLVLAIFIKNYLPVLKLNLSIKTSNSEVTNILQKSAEVLKNSQKQYSLKSKGINFSNSSSVFWADNDGYTVSNSLSSAINMDFSCLSEQNVEILAKNISTEITNLFIKNGYEINKVNSSKSFENSLLSGVYNQAYEKGKIKCSSSVVLDCAGQSKETMQQSVDVACTDNYSVNYEQQLGMLKDLGIKWSYAEIIRKDGNVAYIQTGSSFGFGPGAYEVAKLDPNGHWKRIFGGQDNPTCDVVKKNNISNKIIPECWQGEKSISNPVN